MPLPTLSIARAARCSSFIILLLITVTAPAAALSEPRQAIQANTLHSVHPVLLRKETNPILQLVIETPRAGIVLEGLQFSLAGTEDPADIVDWQLVGHATSGETNAWKLSTFTRVGGSTLEFQPQRLLALGTNRITLAARLSPTTRIDHHVQVTCTSVRTSGGTVIPTNHTPVVRHRVGVALRQHQEDGVHTHRIPALTVTARNTLLAVYDLRRRAGRDLQEDIDIGLSRSTNGGQTWEDPRVIMDMGEFGGLPQAQNGCSDPGILVDRQTGEVFCFAVWMNGKPGKHQWVGDGSEPGFEIGKSAQFLMVRSHDDGRTWSAPENLTRRLKQETWWLLAPSPQSGFQLGDGTLVMPIQGRDANSKEFSTIMTSANHGATWQVGTPAFSGSSECQAALLTDGSILLNMRNERPGERHRAVAVTQDLGRTWMVHPTSGRALIEPNCNGSLLRFETMVNGMPRPILIFANPHSQGARTHQTLQVSFDDGRTWPNQHHLLLDEGRGNGYPSLTQVDATHVGIVYEGSQANLVYERVAMEELGVRP